MASTMSGIMSSSHSASRAANPQGRGFMPSVSFHGSGIARSATSSSPEHDDEEGLDRPLRFGDTITISDLEGKGLVVGDVGVNDTVWLDKREFAEGSKVMDFPDVHNAAFVIAHKFQYAATKDLDKRLRSHHGINKDNWQEKVNPLDPLHGELEASQSLVHDEMETNRAELQRKAGDVVTYGSVVQLWHKNSEKFLTQLKNRAVRNKLAMECLLSVNGSEGSWWQVLPAERIRSVGERVLNGDRVFFENFKFTKSHLAVSQQSCCLGGVMSGTPPHPCISQRLEVNAYAYPEVLRLRLFEPIECYRRGGGNSLVGESVNSKRRRGGKEEVEEEAVQGTDIVTIMHKHHDSLLVGSTQDCVVSWVKNGKLKGSGESRDLEAYLSNQDGEGAGRDEMVEPSALWRIVLRDAYMGGGLISKPSPSLLLEHVATGLYLTASTNGRVALTAYPSDQDCHWVMQAKSASNKKQATAANVKHIRDGELLWIRSAGVGEHVWLSHGQRMLSSCHIGGCAKLGQDDNVATRPGRRENQDIVQIRCVKGAVVVKVDFMRRCRSFLSALQTELMSSGAFVKPEGVDGDSELAAAVRAHAIYAVMECHLETYDALMCKLIRQCTVSDELDVLKRQGTAVKSHQDMLRKIGLIESCMKLLTCIYTDLNIPLSVVEGHLPVCFRFSRLAYLLVEVACKDNRENKVSMLPYTKTFQDHVRGMIGSYFAMLTIFTGTRELIESVDDAKLEYWFSLFKQFKSCKVMNFLQEICQVDGEPVKRNQDRVTNQLVSQAGDMHLTVEIVEDDILLRDPKGKPDQASTSVKSVRAAHGEDVMQHTNLDHKDPNLKLYQYYLQVIKLFSECVLGRNMHAVEALKGVSALYGLSQKVIVNVLSSKGLPYELRCRMVTLFTRLYIDVEPHQPVEMLVTTRVWSHLLSPQFTDKFGRITPGESGMASAAHSQAFAHIKQILVAHMTESCSINGADAALNRLTIEVILALEAMLKFGFFHKYDERHGAPVLDFAQATPLARAIVAVLDGRNDVHVPVKSVMKSAMSSFGGGSTEARSGTGGVGKAHDQRSIDKNHVNSLSASYDARSQDSGAKETDPRFKLSKRTFAVVKIKGRSLMLTKSMLEACVNVRVNRFVVFWESLLEERFGVRCFCQCQSTGTRRENGDFVPAASNGKNASHSNGAPSQMSRRHDLASMVPPAASPMASTGVDYTNSRTDMSSSWELMSMAPGREKNGVGMSPVTSRGGLDEDAVMRETSKSVSVASMTGKGNNWTSIFPRGLCEYFRDIDKWRREPPWSRADLDGLDAQLFGAGDTMLSEEFSLKGIGTMFERGNGGVMPEWIKIVLDLVRHECPYLKQEAIATLITSFNQHANFIATLEKINFIYCPRIAKRYFEMLDDVSHLRRVAGALQAAKGDEQSRACASAGTILSRWVGFVTRNGERWTGYDVTEVQQMADALGCVEVALSIISFPIARIPAEKFGEMDTSANSEVCSVYAQVVNFLSLLCVGNHAIQNKLLESEGLVESLLGIEGVDIEGLFGAIARDNLKVVDAVGKRWIRLLFNSVIAKYGRRRAHVMEAVCCMMKCSGRAIKENQASVMAMFRKYDSIVGHFMQATDEEWDQRIRYMQDDEHLNAGPSSELAFHLSAVKMLYVASEGKNPAAEVYAANYLSFDQVLEVLLHLDESRSTKKQVMGISPSTLYTVRAAFVRLLLHVYVDTRVERLLLEQRKPGNGMWSWHERHGDVCCSAPYMMILLRELKSFASRCRNAKAWHDIGVEEKDYFFGAVTSLLTFYYRDSYPAVRDDPATDPKISEQILRAYEDLYSVEYPGMGTCLMMESPEEGRIDCRERMFGLIKAINVGAGLDSKVVHEAYVRVCTKPIDGNIVRISLGEGTRMVIGNLSELWGISSEGRVGMGHRHLAAMLSRKGTVPIFESSNGHHHLHFPHIHLPHIHHHSPSSTLSLTPSMTSSTRYALPTYDDFVRSILAISRRAGTDSHVLYDILIIVRLMLYVREPSDPDRTPHECQEQWQAFLDHAPIEKLDDPEGECLRWLQSKYSSLGCTEAALRLISHTDDSVRGAAMSLMCALLQGGNSVVQQHVVDYLMVTKDVKVFAVISQVLDGAKERLKDFKRALKFLKTTTEPGSEGKARDGVSESGSGSAPGGAGFGKKSIAMVCLRLVQLMCEGQFKQMQDLLRHQPFAADSKNMITKLSELFEVIQPLMLDAMRFNDGSVVLLAMQVCDTTQELVQGPNEQNQIELVSTSFFSTVNRMLSTVAYTDLPNSHEMVEGLSVGGVSTNDLKCWLKSSVVSCCLSTMEGATTSRIPRRILGFFELRNIEAQIIQCGELLGFAGQKFVGGSCKNSRRPCAYRSHASAKRKLKEMSQRKRFGDGWEDAILSEMLNYHILLLNLKEWEAESTVKDILTKLSREHPRLHRFLSRHVKDVEIVRITGTGTGTGTGAGAETTIVERVFFPIDPSVMELTLTRDFRNKTKEHMFDVPRSNPHEKSRAFLKKMIEIARRIQWMTHNLKNPLRAWIIRRRDVLDILPLAIAIVITLCLLLFYGIPMDPNTNQVLAHGKFYSLEEPAGYRDVDYELADLTSDPLGAGATLGSISAESDLSLKFRVKLLSRWDSEEEWRMWPVGKTLLFALSALHVSMTLVNAIVYLTQDLPLVIFETIQRQRLRQVSSLAWTDASAEEGEDGEQGEDAEEGEGRKGDDHQPQRVHTHCTAKFFKELVWDARHACYHAFMSILSILGLIKSPFFFVCFLLDYFRLPDGILVLNAVILGGPNLVRSFILGLIVITCFGFYSYAYFSNVVNQEQEVCHSPLQCVAKHILDSLTGDLSTVLGDDFGNFAFPALVLWEDSWEGYRTTFVFISLIFWVFLLQSIIQGQIIDAFAEMRSRRSAALNDLEDKCFISSIDRFTFNSYPGEWEKRRGGQYAWHYIHYTSYLFEKPSEDYTGLENSVSECLKTHDISFLPIESLVLQQRVEFANELERGESQEESLRQEMSQLREEMALLQSHQKLSSSASGSFASSLIQRASSLERLASSERFASAGVPNSAPPSSDAASGAAWAPLSEEPHPSMSMATAVDGQGLASDGENDTDGDGAGTWEAAPSLVSFRNPIRMGLLSAQSSPTLAGVAGEPSGGVVVDLTEGEERRGAGQQASSREQLVMAEYNTQTLDAGDIGEASQGDGADSDFGSDDELPASMGVA